MWSLHMRVLRARQLWRLWQIFVGLDLLFLFNTALYVYPPELGQKPLSAFFLFTCLSPDGSLHSSIFTNPELP